MKTTKYIGLIECGSLQKPLFISPVSILQGYEVKKVFAINGTNETNIKSRFPLAEVVSSTKDILDDGSIELVIVSEPSTDDMGMVGEALQAGKQIRII